MKKIASLLFLFVFVFSSCSDDDVDFDTIGQTYELENIDFNVDNNFAIGFTFPNPIFNSDGVLVYRLENVINGFDVWEPLPTSRIIFDNNADLFLEYRFNFTENDVDILIESDDPLALGPEFTQNQVFRIIVVPSAFANDPDVDISNIDNVLSKLSISPDQIKTIQL